MTEFTERVQRVTADLQRLLAELDRAANSGANAVHRERVQRELLMPGVINDFKTAVDDMRMMLWTYMSAQQPGAPDVSLPSLEARLQSVRMQRVTDMLKTLKPDVSNESTSALPEASGFFAMIHDIANTTVERHGAGS